MKTPTFTLSSLLFTKYTAVLLLTVFACTPVMAENGSKLSYHTIRLLDRVDRPCISVLSNDMTLSFSRADIEQEIRNGAKKSLSHAQETVDAVRAAIPESNDQLLCTTIVPEKIPNYAYRNGSSQVVLGMVVKDVLDQLIAQGKVAVEVTATRKSLSVIYAHTYLPLCVPCSRMPPMRADYRQQPDTTPFWNGFVPGNGY